MERVKVINLSKKFGNIPIFHSTTLSFKSGDIVSLTGINGSGKTTFIKVLCGLISPDTGTIFINGSPGDKNRKKWMLDMGVLLDGARSLYWRLTALQNLIYFSGLKGVFGRDSMVNAEKSLKFFKLWDVRDSKVETFSYGMKQRLALACSIPHDPSIIIMDEPTSGLDYVSIKILEDFIHLLSKENKTIILATHDTQIINNLSCTLKLNIRNGIIQ